MKKLFLKGSVIVVLAAGLVAGGAVAANAASLYDNNNYGSFMQTLSSGNVADVANDKASSVTNSGLETYCENQGCSGRKLNWTGNANSLGSIQTGLNPFETWSDRISALG